MEEKKGKILRWNDPSGDNLQYFKSIIELRPLNYYMQLLPSSVCILKAGYSVQIRDDKDHVPPLTSKKSD